MVHLASSKKLKLLRGEGTSALAGLYMGPLNFLQNVPKKFLFSRASEEQYTVQLQNLPAQGYMYLTHDPLCLHAAFDTLRQV